MGDGAHGETGGDTAGGTGDLDVGARLAAWLIAELPGVSELRIEGLRRTSSGFSRKNWVFDATWRDPGGGEVVEQLIVRRDPVGSVLETDRRVEFAVLQAVERSPVPGPVARWLDADGSWLGRPSVIMRREEGDCDWFVLNGDRPLGVRVDIAHQLCDLLADVHRVDWRTLGLGAVLDDPGNQGALAAVDHWEGVLRHHQLEPFPEVELIVHWLRAHAPTAAATVLVHGDFKPGNVLMRGDQVGVLLDWETAHLGDPLEDLGWVTNPVRQGEHRIPGSWEPADLLARWSERTGWAADEAHVRWWNVLANLKLAVITLTGVAAFVDGRFDRVHQAPVGLFRVIFDLIEA